MDKQYALRFSKSAANIMWIIVERVYDTLNRNSKVQAVALDIVKAFDRV